MTCCELCLNLQKYFSNGRPALLSVLNVLLEIQCSGKYMSNQFFLEMHDHVTKTINKTVISFDLFKILPLLLFVFPQIYKHVKNCLIYCHNSYSLIVISLKNLHNHFTWLIITCNSLILVEDMLILCSSLPFQTYDYLLTGKHHSRRNSLCK